MFKRSKLPITNQKFVTDKTYQKIMKELSVKTGTSKGGRPIALSWKTYVKIIRTLEYGATYEDLITEGIIKRNAFYDYRRNSETFSNVTEGVRGTTTRSAIYAMAVAIRGDENTPPDMKAVRWWLTHEKEAKKRFNRRLN